MPLHAMIGKGAALTHRRLSLMVVEDEALIALELETLLRELGHRVATSAGTVGDALAAIKAPTVHIDAALLDANLGGESAAVVAEALDARSVPFVVTSGYEIDDLRRNGFRAPCVRKPYSRAGIETALNAVIGD